MKNIKNLILSLLVLIAAGVVGWGTYTFAGSSHSHGHAHSSEEGHAGHEHDRGSHGKDSHRQGAEKPDAHGDAHEDEDDEELEALFSGGSRASEDSAGRGNAHSHPRPSGKDDHAGHDHGPRRAARSHDHGGHDHGHRHGGGEEICPEHNVAEFEDALCHPEEIALLQAGQGMKVRLAAPEMARRVGIASALPLPAAEGSASWPGQIVFNRDRLARLSALAGGSVQKVNVGLGERVAKGQVLGEIASSEAAGLRAELSAAESRRSLAEAVYLREKDLLEKGITSRHDYQQAEADLRQAQSAAQRARRQVQDFGLGDGKEGSILPIRAPFAGTVIERRAVVGESVSPGEPLFVLADLETLWVEISIPEDSLLNVHPGLEVVTSFSGLPGRAFPGKIFWVSPALDERTRMLRVLAEVDNREGLMRSGLFGQVQALEGAAARTLAVPSDALQTVDGNPFVFVHLEDDLFELRRVTAGRRNGGTVVIREGLQAHDRVVTGQAFSLKSEVLRARLGASCADH